MTIDCSPTRVNTIRDDQYGHCVMQLCACVPRESHAVSEGSLQRKIECFSCSCATQLCSHLWKMLHRQRVAILGDVMTQPMTHARARKAPTSHA